VECIYFGNTHFIGVCRLKLMLEHYNLLVGSFDFLNLMRGFTINQKIAFSSSTSAMKITVEATYYLFVYVSYLQAYYRH